MRFNKENIISLGFLMALFLTNLQIAEADKEILSFCYLPSPKLAHSLLLKKLEPIKGLNFQTKQKIAFSIQKASSKTDLPEVLLFELIKKESSFRPNAISPVGARGLTQLMPSTAKHICNLALPEIYDIEKNIDCGAKYLNIMLKDFKGDLKLALAAYNIGPGHIRRIQKRYSRQKGFHEIQHLIHSKTRYYAISINNSYLKTV